MTDGALPLVTALGRLLSDPAQRAAFLSDREAWLEAAAVEEAGRETLRRLEAGELEAQATVLLDKRLGEVAELIPRTARALGRRYPELFRRYAPATWPRGHLRHPRDALEFLEWLREREPGAISGLDEILTRAQLRRRAGSRWTLGVGHHADHWVSGLDVVFSMRRGKLRTFIPLPFPSALGRRWFWPPRVGEEEGEAGAAAAPE